MAKTDSTLRDSSDRRHLLRRLTFAAAPSTERAVEGKSADAILQTMIAGAKKASMPKAPSWMAPVWTNRALRFTDTTNAQIVAARNEVSQSNARDAELLRQWWLQEMITGSAPLRENMVLFFHSVFGGSSRSIDGPQALYGYISLLRRSCFGTIPALLDALIVEPAMIMQESFDESKKEKPSDFSARRILDQWTVGAGNYKDSDALSLARAITGWVLEAPKGQEPTKPIDPQAFRSNRRTGLVPVFHPEWFDDGPKTLLGTTRNFGAKDAIQYLATHEATARRFAGLLVRYFGVDDPAHRLESELFATYNTTKGSMEALLRALILSDEFWSPSTRWKLIKSPVHLAVGACRQLELADPPVAAISTWLGAAGQRPLDAPNFGGEGWPGQDAWVTPADRLAARFQLGTALFGGKSPWGLNPQASASSTGSVAALPKPVQQSNTADLIARLDPGPGLNVQEIESHVAKVPAAERAQEAIRKVLATPEYQIA
jgi:uncharacterized protein (DUF1800 family)